MSRKLLAWVNLAYHFWKHVLTRLWLRPFRRGRDIARFTAQVYPEGYLPLTAAERALFPEFMRCIHCGLCSISCPAFRHAPLSAWWEMWTFVGGPSRSLDRAELAAFAAEPCIGCDVCTAVCPTGVPINSLVQLVSRMGEQARQERRMTGTTRAAAAALLLLLPLPLMSQQTTERPRARDLGIAVGVFDPGRLNAITDVAGVRVGHTTLHQGTINTGVTAVLPPGDDWYHERVPAAIVVGNGFGKLLGISQVQELGELETPVLLTCTLCVWQTADALVEWLLARPGMDNVRSINPVVGETNDGTLNDIRSRPITKQHVLHALESAGGGAVEEGAVGAGAGTVAFGWKGGIGTSSRVLPANSGGYTVGVLVQSNFGGVLAIDGAPVGVELGRYSFQRRENSPRENEPTPDGSIMMVVATDAPLDHLALERVAKRALTGLARTGSAMSNGSGDYVIAFSTAESVRRRASRAEFAVTSLANDALSPLFQAVAEATEEAVYNSLLKAVTTSNGTTTVDALPIDRVREILKKYGKGKN